jgi:hypothetical protein
MHHIVGDDQQMPLTLEVQRSVEKNEWERFDY